MKSHYTLLIIFFLLFRGLHAQQVELEIEATGVGYIVDIAHVGDERIFCLTKPGVIRIVENGIVLPVPFLDISSQVINSGEQGALGLAFDPDFANNGKFFIHYICNIVSSHSRISSFTVSASDPNVADPATEQIIYTVMQSSSIHKGGDLDFGADGMLYITFGDFGGSPNAQNYSSPLGAILRLDVSGEAPYSIPADNPYVNATDTLPVIWAKGLRNPWRFGFDALTGDLWIGDVGSASWEEVNYWPAGDHSGPNFGWRCYEGFVQVTSTTGCGPVTNYDMPVAVQPTTGAWCSLIGGRVYRGETYPDLYGRYIYSDYCAGLIYSLMPDGSGGWTNELLTSAVPTSIICIGENAALDLFLGRSDGTLYRLVDPLTTQIETVRPSPITVFPQPANGMITITGDLANVRSVQLIDRTGRTVLDRKLAGLDRADLDLSGVANGSYVLGLSSSTGAPVHRQVVILMH
ncbi:MAG: PQQ-dependent sugar dehydrogenase [Bacteroidota bacterium]|nr:PQQ-dependent sugar dehydrogenase [Bacteroidota bacterium]